MNDITLDSKQFNQVEYSEDVSTTAQIEKYLLDILGQDGDVNTAKILHVINARSAEILSQLDYVETALNNL